MNIKERATQYWTELLEALRADGIVATIITQSGPATTNFIVAKCNEPEPANGPWLPMTMFPQPGVQVVAVRIDKGALCVLTYNEQHASWMANGRRTKAGYYKGWTFIKPPQEGEV
jgi:hypothetical protein